MESCILATAINCTLQDLRDKQFITSFKKQLDGLPDKDKEDKNVSETIKLLADILNRDMSEKQECLFEISSRDFTDDLKSLIDDTTKYTKVFKRDFITKLSANRSMSVLKPFTERLTSLIDKIELNNGKRATEALYELYDVIDDMQKTAYKVKTSSSSGNMVIIDPINKSTHDTMGPVLEELKQAVSNKIKSIVAIDNMVGGGFAPKTFNMFGAIGGNGKSLTLQNILLYASKNNSSELFDLDPGLCPCLLFISLELTKKQCFQRQLAWCGIKVTDDELLNMSEEELEHMAMEWSIKTELKLPIVYIERIQGQFSTSIVEIDSECSNLVNMGFQPVMIAVDYLDRLEVSSMKHRNLTMATGAEGSALLRQKGAECRELSIRRNCPVISAAQLNGEAQSELTRVEAYLKKVDIVHHFGTGMLAGSKQLQTELDTIIFQHKIEIENKSQEGDTIETTEFIAMSVMKDRDGHSRYKISSRDKINEVQYRKYTQSLKNSVLSELIRDTARIHAVIPLHMFRLDEVDYARSIRMFYPNEKVEFVSIGDVMKSYHGERGEDFVDIAQDTGAYSDSIDNTADRMAAIAGI